MKINFNEVEYNMYEAEIETFKSAFKEYKQFHHFGENLSIEITELNNKSPKIQIIMRLGLFKLTHYYHSKYLTQHKNEEYQMIEEQEAKIEVQTVFMEEVKEFMGAFPEFRKIMNLWESKKDKVKQLLELQPP